MSQTTFPIPTEFQKMSITKAHEVMSIPRTSFYRNYLDNGEISIKTDDQGKKYIDFSELYRVFGEEALQKVSVYPRDTPKSQFGESGTQKNSLRDTETYPVHTELLIENAKLKERTEALQERISEKDNIIQRQNAQIEKLEGKVSNLLEDKSKSAATLPDPASLAERIQKELLSSMKGHLETLSLEQSALIEKQQDELAKLREQVSTLSEDMRLQETAKQKSFWNKLLGRLQVI